MNSKRVWPLAVLLAVVLYALWPRTVLQAAYNGQRCYLAGNGFVLQWRHSVERQLWREHYVVRAGRLWLSKTEMQTFGAGMPSSGSPSSASAGFVAQSSTVTLPELNWVVSRRMQGEIYTGNDVWAVYRQVPDYTEIHIQPTRMLRVQQWLGAQCHES